MRRALFDQKVQWLELVQGQRSQVFSLERFLSDPDKILDLHRDRLSSYPAKNPPIVEKLIQTVLHTSSVAISFFTMCILPTNLENIWSSLISVSTHLVGVGLGIRFVRSGSPDIGESSLAARFTLKLNIFLFYSCNSKSEPWISEGWGFFVPLGFQKMFPAIGWQ